MAIETKEIKALGKKLKFAKSERYALSELIAYLKTSWPGVKFKLYGSKVKGIADEESDIDLLIMLPCNVTEEIRKKLIYTVFDINLTFETNISTLIIARVEWESAPFSLLPTVPLKKIMKYQKSQNLHLSLQNRL